MSPPGRPQGDHPVAAPAQAARPGLLTRLAGPFKEFGALAGTLYMVDRAMRAVSPRLGLEVYEFMVQPIDGQPLLPPNLSKNLSFQEIGPGHPDIALMPAREDIKALRFEQGARCLGAYRKGELISYLWYGRPRYHEDMVRCTYELGDAASAVFDFDLYVMPKHRLGLGFMGIWHGANQVLWPQGVRQTFSRVTRFNTASRRAHARLGARCIGRAVFVCAWRLEIMVGTLAPYLAVGLGERQRVRLRLAAPRPTPTGPAPAPAAPPRAG